MLLLKNILNVIYSGWCIALFFFILFLLLFVYVGVYFMNDRFRTTTVYHANKLLTRLWMALCGYKIIIEGAEKIDPAKTYMFIGNHANMLDIPVTGYFLQHYYKSLVKKELRYVPIFGFLINVSSIRVDRSSHESRRLSTQIIVDKLRQGVSILIFPEGSRNKTNKPLKSFYSGAFKTAVMAGVPILPFVYLDHRLLQPVGTFRLHPGTIRVKVLDAVETSDIKREDAGALQERIYKMMEDVIWSEDKNFKTN